MFTFSAVDRVMTTKDQLTGFGSALSQTGAVNYVVQTGFQEDQEIFHR